MTLEITVYSDVYYSKFIVFSGEFNMRNSNCVSS